MTKCVFHVKVHDTIVRYAQLPLTSALIFICELLSSMGSERSVHLTYLDFVKIDYRVCQKTDWFSVQGWEVIALEIRKNVHIGLDCVLSVLQVCAKSDMPFTVTKIKVACLEKGLPYKSFECSNKLDV